eukprot:2949242-Alexandrium_andersonii.AAC.1
MGDRFLPSRPRGALLLPPPPRSRCPAPGGSSIPGCRGRRAVPPRHAGGVYPRAGALPAPGQL